MGDENPTFVALQADVARLRSHVESALGGPNNARGSVHESLDEVRADLKRVLKRLHGDPDADDAPPGVVQRLRAAEEQAKAAWTSIELCSADGKFGLKSRIDQLEKAVRFSNRIQAAIGALAGAALLQAILSKVIS